MPRLLGALFCVVAFATAAPFAVAAEPSAAPSPRASAEAGEPGPRGRNAGTIDGEVVAVDYRAGTIAILTGGRRVDVVVLPSTNIQGDDGFHTIADIKKGSHVQVILSRRAGTFIAQIIHLQ